MQLTPRLYSRLALCVQVPRVSRDCLHVLLLWYVFVRPLGNGWLLTGAVVNDLPGFMIGESSLRASSDVQLRGLTISHRGLAATIEG